MLATKLYIPPPRSKLVRRPRLIERLNASLQRRLTLIAAPAGFGKTTLVSEWIAGCGRPTAWLSLDKGDDDLIPFLTHLITALQTIAPNIGAGVLGVLQSTQPPRDPAGCEALLTALLNELTTLPDPCVLVLDDYHVLEATAIDLALSFLLEHLPPPLHLVIATRADPQLSLARYRAQGQLTELRAADLRFTAAEAAEFLNQVMGLSLSAADIAALEERTEGWIAGLQLAALSLQGHQDARGFIRAFAGDHRYIVDYLVEEVLQRQPAPVRSFLLQTAILERLSGALCDAVTGQLEGSARLEALQRGNFFVVPLDDKRHWYRYHHLFGEVLHAHLLTEQPDQVSTLHRRASEWYERHGAAADAIRHALAAQDFARAADLVELAVPAMRQSREEAAVLRWLQALPDELVRARPVLSVYYAWALLASGELEGVEARLQDAERWLDTGMDTGADMGAVVVDKTAFRRLPGAITVFRAGQALALGDVAGTVTYARRALDLVPEDDHLMRGAAASLLGLASWATGDLEAAHRMYAEGMVNVRIAGSLSDAIGCAVALAEIRMAQGRLHEAASTYARALQLATAPPPEGTGPVLRGAADIYVGMSELAREHDDLQAATQHLVSSKELGEHTGLPRYQYRWCVAMARIREAQGDLAAALDLLQEAERLYVSDFFPNVRPVAALKTRMWVAQGRLGEARSWVREQGLASEDNLSYLREFEHITLARVLLAEYTRARSEHTRLEAIELLDRLLHAAEAGERMRSVIEILVLQALAHLEQGHLAEALVALERALRLAEREGYVRVFIDEGLPMARLLATAAAQGLMPDRIGSAYIGKLLAAFAPGEAVALPLTYSPAADIRDKPALSPRPQPLIEPLSARELEILQLIGQGLSNGEISARLFLALSTIKGHNLNIFGKLQVQRRTEAVARARALGLL